MADGAKLNELLLREEVQRKLNELLLREEVQSQLISKFIDQQVSSALLEEVASLIKSLLHKKLLQEGINIEIPKFDVLFDNQNSVLIIKWRDETTPQKKRKRKTKVIGLLYEILLKNDNI
jgi:hypothetical protein